MVQIIQENKKPSTRQNIGQLLSGLGNVASDVGSQYMQMQEQARSDQRLNDLTGMNLAGLHPKLQEIALAADLRSQGKERLMGQKQDLLGQIFGQRGQQRGIGQQLAGQEPQEGVQMPQGFDASQLSDAQIAQATALDPNLGRILQHEKDVGLREAREVQKQEFQREKIGRKEAHEVVKPLLQELNLSRKNIPLQEQAIEDIQKASPDVGALDYLADVTGFEPLRSAKGAQLKTAIKDFFLSDLTRAGSRPNQWIEMQLSEALPKLGRSTEANLTVAEGMKFKVDLAKKRIEILDSLIERDKEKVGYVKDDIDARASQLMKPYVEQRKKDLVDSIKKIQKETKGSKKATPKGYTRMQNPQTGEIFEILNGHVQDAEEAGWLAH